MEAFRAFLPPLPFADAEVRAAADETAVKVLVCVEEALKHGAAANFMQTRRALKQSYDAAIGVAPDDGWHARMLRRCPYVPAILAGDADRALELAESCRKALMKQVQEAPKEARAPLRARLHNMNAVMTGIEALEDLRETHAFVPASWTAVSP